MTKEESRTILIERIKAMGQEVIDRAEDLAGSGDLIGDLTITLRFEDGGVVRPAELELTRMHYSKRDVDILTGGIAQNGKNKKFD